MPSKINNRADVDAYVQSIAQRPETRMSDGSASNWAAYAESERQRLYRLLDSRSSHNRLVRVGKVASAIPAAFAVAPGGVLAAGGGTAAGGTSMASMAPSALPSATSGIGTTAGYSSLFGGAAAAPAAVAAPTSIIAPSVAAAGGARMSDLMRFGVPAATSLVTGHMASRASERGNNAALDAQQRQFDATQAWLREAEANNERRHKEAEDEKRRQWDATESEKRRRWDAKEPWRASSRQALTRMSDFIDRGPTSHAYRPTFRYEQ